MTNTAFDLGFNVVPYGEVPGFRVAVTQRTAGFRVAGSGPMISSRLAGPFSLLGSAYSPERYSELGAPIGNDALVPVADVPDAANDNRSACDRAIAYCRATARARRLPPDAYLSLMSECQDVYELCLNRQNDPHRIGSKGSLLNFPDGGRVIFRPGQVPVYTPSPKGVPPL